MKHYAYLYEETMYRYCVTVAPADDPDDERYITVNATDEDHAEEQAMEAKDWPEDGTILYADEEKEYMSAGAVIDSYNELYGDEHDAKRASQDDKVAFRCGFIDYLDCLQKDGAICGEQVDTIDHPWI